MCENIPEKIYMDDIPMAAFHKRTAAFCFGAHFVDGYLLGTISIALALMAGSTEISSLWQGLVGSSALIGIFIGSLVLGHFSDKAGRKKVLQITFASIAAASFLQLFVNEIAVLFILRVVIGFFVGGVYSGCISYLSEILPKKQRGDYLGLLSAVWTIGYCTSTIAGFAVQQHDAGAWNFLLASAALPAVILFAASLKIPESPRWLMKCGRHEDAMAIVHKYFGDGVLIEENEDITDQSFGVIFSKQYRKQTAFASLFFVCNVIPYFAVYTFLPAILKEFGIREGFATDMLLNVVLVAGGFIGLFCTIHLTRRKFAIGGFAICTISLFMVVIIPSELEIWLVAAFVIFTLAISAISNLSVIFPPEVFPTNVRSSGVGFAVAMSRIGAASGTFLLPVAMSSIGVHPSLGILAAILLLGTFICFRWAPETKGMSLSEAASNSFKA